MDNRNKIKSEIVRPQYLKNIPKTLYKYRDWKNNYHQKLLLETELYFASSNQFNDPFDCSLPFLLNNEDQQPEEIFKRLITNARKYNSNKSELALHNEIFYSQKKGVYTDEQYLIYIANEHRKEIENSFGILSLAKEEDNFLMWSHYANSHSGFCLGFDTYKLHQQCEGALEAIQYTEDIPVINLKMDTYEEIENYFRTTLMVKSAIWSYEKEYRLTKNAFARGKRIITPDCITEIIFGCKMEDKIKLKLLEVIEKIYPDAEVFEMKLHKTKYKLEKHQIR